ncbi:hypothetical protein [Loktanella sp. Alg231-35]|uniref:hypothetical protein n=1 Tax=Loktanella sp. Alg231-35 TaxID=1922220 RepID=UPI000D551CA7|nr:hypothetical protein [Loktanella sp. Alg231-35]
MSITHFITSQIISGVWEGTLAGAGTNAPALTASHEGRTLEGVTVSAGGADGLWLVQVPIPAELISDGVQTVLIKDQAEDTLGSFAILAGQVLAQDLRAEIALLRAELDMLKQSFRQHCNEN